MSQRLGTFDRLIAFQREVETGQDSLGQPVKEWRTYSRAWGSVTQTAEDEVFSAPQRYATRAITVSTHYRDDIREWDRIAIGVEIYGIKGTREIGRREAIEIKANRVL